MSKFNLLVITDISPLPIMDGYSLRVYNLMINLLKYWDVDLICLKPEKEEFENQLKAIFNNINFVEIWKHFNNKKLKHLERIKNLLLPPRYLYALNIDYLPYLEALIKNKISRRFYDSILCYRASTFGFYLSQLYNLNIVCDVIDAANLYIRSIMSNKKIGSREWLSLYYAYLYNQRWERKYLVRCRKITTVSERDKEWLGKTIDVERVYVVENGVDASYFTPDIVNPGTENGLVIFTGVMGYDPNHDAMVYCLKNIWPLIKKEAPEAKLKIVGRYPKQELIDLAKRQRDVEITGEVEDIRKAVKGACVFLCPMRVGAGIKNKILESLAMGIPVVTSSEGAQGIEFENSRVGYIADTPEDMAKYTVTLLKKTSKWDSLSKAARKLVVEKYSWQSKAEKLSAILLA